MNINEVFEHIAQQMQHHSDHLARLVELQATLVKTEVRGGVDTFAVTSLLNVAQQIKTADGMLYGFWAFNAGTAIRYLKFYESMNQPIVGTSRVKIPMGVPVGSGAVMMSAVGIPFHNGIWAAATTGMADSDTAAPSASEILLVAFFK